MTKDLYNKPERGARRQQIRSRLMLLQDELARLHKEKMDTLYEVEILKVELLSINNES